jgi:hypothetical protein
VARLTESLHNNADIGAIFLRGVHSSMSTLSSNFALAHFSTAF